jgi:hypothetical protein
MSVVEIDGRLGDRFRLLRSGRPTAERHRTLQAAVAWSYDLPRDDERDLFDRMAVFADGCLVDGIAAVADLDDYDTLDVLDALVARSMVTTVPTPLGTRYRQLETLRQYAEDRLVEQGIVNDVRDRHLLWARDLGASIRDSEGTPSAAAQFRRYCAEVDNLRVAAAHAVSSNQREMANEMLAYTWRCAIVRPTFDAQRWFDPTKNTPPWTAAAAEAVGLHAGLAFLDGDTERLGKLVAAVPAEYRHAFPVAWAWFLDELWCRVDPDAADAVLAQCRPRNGSEALMVGSLSVNTGFARMHLPNQPSDLVETTRRRANEFLAAARRAGDDIDTAYVLIGHAFTDYFSGGFEVAYRSASEALMLAERWAPDFRSTPPGWR